MTLEVSELKIAPSARAEWRLLWPLCLVAMLGTSSGGMFAYSSGVFIEYITADFGWSRAQYSTVFVGMMLLSLVVGPAVGSLIDRWGPRRIALAAIVPFAATFSALGLTTGSLWQWTALCLVLAVWQGAVGQVVWISAVISRFHASRGLAMAVTLSGLGFGTLLWPILAATLIARFGWRPAFLGIAMTWAAIVLPLTLAFFYGAKDLKTAPDRNTAAASPLPAADRELSFKEAVLSYRFISLAFAGGISASASYGMSLNFVPVLRGAGVNLVVAASIAGSIGIFSITGRLLTGYLLDRFPTRPIGIAAFLLPVLPAMLLFSFPGSVAVASISAVLLGLAAGAEIDIITYIASRCFGGGAFASIYGLFMAVLAVVASLGPVLASAIYDATKAYDGFLLAVVLLVALASLAIATIPLEVTSARRQ